MLYVICHNIRSLHNVGSIFRTADGAGVSKIFLCGITPTPYLDVSSSEELARKLSFQKELNNINDKARGQAGAPSACHRLSLKFPPFTKNNYYLKADIAFNYRQLAGRPRKEISKVALGAENFVPWEKCRQTACLIKKLKKEGVKIIALE